ATIRLRLAAGLVEEDRRARLMAHDVVMLRAGYDLDLTADLSCHPLRGGAEYLGAFPFRRRRCVHYQPSVHPGIWVPILINVVRDERAVAPVETEVGRHGDDPVMRQNVLPKLWPSFIRSR